LKKLNEKKKMRNCYGRKRTLKSKIPPALSQDFFLDQQKVLARKSVK
jgi:hypothetical protein